jgi:hypothetical protein
VQTLRDVTTSFEFVKRRQHFKENFVNIALAGLAIMLLGTMPALWAGFEQVTVPDPAGPPLEAGILVSERNARSAAEAWAF